VPEVGGPEVVMPIEELVAAPMAAIVWAWEGLDPSGQVDAYVSACAPELLACVAVLTGLSTDALASAFESGDRRAHGAVQILFQGTVDAAELLRQRCVRWRELQLWAALDREAGLLSYLAECIGRGLWICGAQMLRAAARRALGDTSGAVQAYRVTIEVATALGDNGILAIAYDNLGNSLSDLGEIDEALYSFHQAFARESNGNDRNTILMNEAITLTVVGELRQAVKTHQRALAELLAMGIDGTRLAIQLDNLASTLLELREVPLALEHLARAASLIGGDELGYRAVNAQLQAKAHQLDGDRDAEERSFLTAYRLACAQVRQDRPIEHYRAGFAAAREHAAPPTDQVWRLFGAALERKESEAWPEASALFGQAVARARQLGDEALALRLEANMVALLGDAGQFAEAVAMAVRVRSVALERGLALPEMFVVATLSNPALAGVDVGEQMGALGLLATAEVLRDIHTRVVLAADLDAEDRQIELLDTGALDSQISTFAQSFHAFRMAAEYLDRAVAVARRHGLRFELANRLSGLAYLHSQLGDEAAHDRVIVELRELVDAGGLPLRGEVVARRALASRLADTDPTAAISELRRAAACGEELRLRIPPGPRRADVARQFTDIYPRLADLLRRQNQPGAAFEALQQAKARRYLDARQLAHGDQPDAPMSLARAQELVSAASVDRPTTLVDFDARHDAVTANLVDRDGLRTIHVPGDFASLADIGAADAQEREKRLVEACRESPLLAELVSRIHQAVPPNTRLLLVPDAYLHNLPLHTVPVDDKPWCDQASIGYLPAAAALRQEDEAVATGTAGRSSFVAGDSSAEHSLPWAAKECSTIARLLGTEAKLGPQCTVAAFEQALSSDLDVIHLAIHGRGDTRRGGRASLLFADGSGGHEWVPFDRLAALTWRTRLVVFSGCGTGIVGPHQGNELVGVARAAAEAGVASVLATLWPVADEAAETFMVAFYTELHRQWQSPAIDLLAALDTARDALRTRLAASLPGGRRRDGRDVLLQADDAQPVVEVDGATEELLLWGPFVLFGEPVLRHQAEQR
jgi:CHAT domain-containing protein